MTEFPGGSDDEGKFTADYDIDESIEAAEEALKPMPDEKDEPVSAPQLTEADRKRIENIFRDNNTTHTGQIVNPPEKRPWQLKK